MDLTKFPTNLLIWFRNEYRSCEEFRRKYVSDDLRRELDGASDISQKTTPAARLQAESTYVWNHWKFCVDGGFETIKQDYRTAKLSWEFSWKCGDLITCYCRLVLIAETLARDIDPDCSKNLVDLLVAIGRARMA